MTDFSDLLIQSSPLLIVMTAPDGTVMMMGDSMLRALGYSLEEVIGEPLAGRFVAAECRDDIRALFEESGETGRCVSAEIRFITRQGGEIPVEWQVQTVFRDGGGIDFFFGAGLDLTERKRMECELMREREEQLQMFDSIPAMVFYKNKNNRFIRVNRAFSTLLGLPKKQIEGAAMRAILPEIAEKSGGEDKEVIATGRPKRNILDIVETPDGPRWIKSDKFPFRDEEGKIIGILGVAVDITEPKGAEEAIQALLDGAGGYAGANLFDRMTGRIREWLGTDFAVVLGIPDEERAEVLSLQDGEGVISSFGFRVGDTLFARVCREGYLHLSRGAGKSSPVTEEVFRDRIEGFAGAAILDRNGIPVGCICAASRRGLLLPRRAEEVLHIFAAKAALEIERIRSRTALRESEERYRTLVETSPDAIMMTSLDGSIVTVNRQFAVLVGEDVRNILSPGRMALEYFGGDALMRVVRNTRRLIAGRDSRISGEYVIHRRNDPVFPAEVSMSLIRDEHGAPRNFIGIIRDITERKETERRLLEEHALLEARLRNERMLSEIASLIASAETLESIFPRVVGIIRQRLSPDRVFIFRYSSEGGACTVIADAGDGGGGFSCGGFCRSRLLRDMLRERKVVDVTGLPELEDSVREAIAASEVRSLTLFSLGSGHSATGALVLCWKDARRLQPEEADLFGIIADMIASAIERDTDFRARLDAEHRHAEAVKMAERSSRLAAIGTLAAGISHEINQPLTALKVKVDSILYWKELNEHIPQEDLEQDLRFLSQQAERIDDIIKHMRALSRQERGHEPGDTDLNQVVQDVLPLLRQRISAHGINVIQNLDATLPPLRGYRTLLQQVVINLIVNAINAHDEHAGSEKSIQVTTRYDDRNCYLEVTDNGPGIPEENLGRIFDPFFTTKVGSEGMGLGLSICHNIVDGLGGVISAENVPGGGARFLVSIPITSPGAAEHEHPPC